MFKIPKVEQMFVENLSKVEILKLREDVDYLLATNQSLLNL